MRAIRNAIGTSGETLTVAQMLLRYLALEGVDHLFGIPGGGLANLLTELKNQRDKFQYVVCRHETGAAYMADGYFRATGTLGVVMVTSGPGATNALTGTMNADNGGSALLTLTGEVSEQFYGKGYLQEGIDARLDIDAIYKAASAYSAVITDASDAQALLEQALRDALSLPRRAAHLSFPNNVSVEPLKGVAVPTAVQAYRSTPAGASRAQVRQALASLLGARRPLIMLGNGCRQALREPVIADAFARLVERHGIPVMTTADGKGLFPETHALSLRVYGVADCMWPQYWLKPEQAGAPPYDALLVLGSSLGELSTNSWNAMLVPQGPFMQVDLDQRVIGRAFHVSLGIVAEVGAFIADLCALAEDEAPAEGDVQDRKALVTQIKQAHSPFFSPAQYEAETHPIEPAALVRVLQGALPPTSMIFIDAGNCVGWAAHYLAVDPPQEIHSCLSMGPMGFAVGAVVGAKLGAPHRTCLALVGDGAFLMHGAEVSTASRHRVGAIWVVLYDDDLHMVSQGQEHFFPDKHDPGIWSELYALGRPDIAGFARAMGADAHEVHAPAELQRVMPQVIARADTAGHPQVVVAHIHRASSPPYYNPQY